MSRVEDIYLLQKAKPKSKDAVTSVKCPEDPEIEIMGALKVEGEEPRDGTQAFLPQNFKQSIPHMKFQRFRGWSFCTQGCHYESWQGSCGPEAECFSRNSILTNEFALENPREAHRPRCPTLSSRLSPQKWSSQHLCMHPWILCSWWLHNLESTG